MDNSRTVVDDLLRGRKAERVGLMDSPWADTIWAWVAEGYPTRKVFKKKGQSRWRPEDGRWEDALQDGEYEEPVPAWGFLLSDAYAGGGGVGSGSNARAMAHPAETMGGICTLNHG